MQTTVKTNDLASDRGKAGRTTAAVRIFPCFSWSFQDAAKPQTPRRPEHVFADAMDGIREPRREGAVFLNVLCDRWGHCCAR